MRNYLLVYLLVYQKFYFHKLNGGKAFRLLFDSQFRTTQNGIDNSHIGYCHGDMKNQSTSLSDALFSKVQASSLSDFA